MARRHENRSFPDGWSLVDAITSVRFKPVRIAIGYDMREVDDLLDRLVDAVRAGLPVRPLVAAATLGTTRWREGYDKAEVDAFLAEVARRAEA